MDTMRRGEIAGILCLIAVVASFVAAFVFGVGKSAMGDVVSLVIYVIVCVTYLALLLAVQEIVKSVGDVVFVHRMRVFLFVVVATYLLFAPLTTPFFVPDWLEAILVFVAIVLTAIFGVVSIRVAPFFDKLEGRRAEYGRKAARWLKISGWLMATVILSVFGAIASLVADFYMWRLVRSERLNANSK